MTPIRVTAVRYSDTTIWNILDKFLIDLATIQDSVCSKSPSLSRPLYQGLVDLVCKGNTGVLNSIDFGKPYYPFILITYYVLFHRHDLETAETVYEKLKEAYEKQPYTFTPDEECSLKVLGKVIEDFTVLRGQQLEKYKGRLNIELGNTESKIEKIKCHLGVWSNAFKMLIISHLNPEKAKENLMEIREMMESQSESLDTYIDDEIVEGYNLIIYRAPQPVLIFISKIAGSLYRRLLATFDTLKSKEIDKKFLEKELSDAEKIMTIQRFIKKRVKDAPTILTIILFDIIPLAGGGALGAMIYNYINALLGLALILAIVITGIIDIVLSTYYVLRKRKLLKINEEIEKFIEENILADIYKTIWPELKVQNTSYEPHHSLDPAVLI
jgi:hypothetical protein